LRIGVFFALAALGACTTTSDDTVTIARTVDACSPLALVSATPTDVQHAGMQAAMELWRERGAPALGRRAGATMDVIFEDAAPAFRGLYDDQAGLIYINRGITDEATLSIVIAHELGHAFGLLHVDASERISVMNPGNLDTPPTAADQAAIEGLWGVCGD
jgi:hypothetical protein